MQHAPRSTASKAQHCRQARSPGTYGYLITTPQGRRTFYAPDTSDLKPEVIDILKGVDNLVMDSTFWENHGTARSHHDVRQTVHEGIDILDAGHVYLTHLAPHMSEAGVNEIDEMYRFAEPLRRACHRRRRWYAVHAVSWYHTRYG